VCARFGNLGGMVSFATGGLGTPMWFMLALGYPLSGRLQAVRQAVAVPEVPGPRPLPPAAIMTNHRSASEST